jgi:hypothetical protein
MGTMLQFRSTDFCGLLSLFVEASGSAYLLGWPVSVANPEHVRATGNAPVAQHPHANFKDCEIARRWWRLRPVSS